MTFRALGWLRESPWTIPMAVVSAVALAVGGLFALMFLVIGGTSFSEYQTKANTACGDDATIDVTYDGGGFARGRSFTTRCRSKLNGEVYAIVTKVPRRAD